MTDREFYLGYRERLETKLKQKSMAAQASVPTHAAERLFKSADGRYTKAGESPAPSAQLPQDSLSMITGGKDYSEAAKKAAQQAAAASGEKTVAASGGSSSAANDYDWARHDREWRQCCADAGGAWQRGSYDEAAYQACRDVLSCQAACGCCNGPADWSAAAGLPSCRAAGSRSHYSLERFRCARQ